VSTEQPISAGQSPRPGAVIIGGDYQGLGIVRSLGRRGVPTCVIDDERSIARFSRYATNAVACKDLRDEHRTVASVLDIGARLGLDGWVLYPTRDETVAAFSRHRSELAERFRVPTPGWEVVRSAWDKRATYALAGELGIPAPRTWYPTDLTELDAIEAEPPFAIKPAIKEHFLYATKSKAWKAETRGQLRTLFERAAGIVEHGEVMIQELVPGDGRQQFAYCAFFKDQQAVATMVVQRRRQHPPEFGRASTFVQTVEIPALEVLAEKFLRSIDYYGLVELEFKLDPRDGQFKLLDVNARTWGYHAIGARAGVDFPYLLYADQVGERVERCRAAPGVRWIRLATDVPTAVVEFMHRRLDWRAYGRSVTSSDVEAVFSMHDPVPGLVECGLIPYLAFKRGL
jgi:predicted ATP-grasp superfamily ATP-dependent carboligase